jgi:hypothetical protein
MLLRNRQNRFSLILKLPLLPFAILLWFTGWALCCLAPERKNLVAEKRQADFKDSKPIMH